MTDHHTEERNLEGGVGESSSQEGTNRPTTGGAQKNSPSCGSCIEVVIPEPVGQGLFQGRNCTHEKTGRTSVANEVGCHSGLPYGPGLLPRPC